MSRRRRERGASPADSRPTAPRGREEDTPLTRQGAILFGVGVAVVFAGFVLLAQGSITLAPILLVLGFLGLFPLALTR